jgi:hypothetical protein
MPSDPELPPLEEIFARREFAERHPRLLNRSRVEWALRNRSTNGLEAAGGVYASPCGQLLVHEPAFLAWFLGLKGRSKPRAARRKRAGAA